MSDIKPGDRVRVTFEGEVTDAHPGRNRVRVSSDGDFAWVDLGERIEKIEPPVEVFKPGDRLRRKGFGNYEVTLADEGYLQHFETGAVGFYKYWGSPERELFNSERYERVALG